jgi:hypothetical protein
MSYDFCSFLLCPKDSQSLTLSNYLIRKGSTSRVTTCCNLNCQAPLMPEMAEKLDCFGPLLHRPGMQFRGTIAQLRQHDGAKCWGKVAKKSLEQKHVHRWLLWYSTTQVAGLEAAYYCHCSSLVCVMNPVGSKCCIFVENVCQPE